MKSLKIQTHISLAINLLLTLILVYVFLFGKRTEEHPIPIIPIQRTNDDDGIGTQISVRSHPLGGSPSTATHDIDLPLELPLKVAQTYLLRSGWTNAFDGDGKITDEAALICGLTADERAWLQDLIEIQRDHIRKEELIIAEEYFDENGDKWIILPPNVKVVEDTVSFFEETLIKSGFTTQRASAITQYIYKHDEFVIQPHNGYAYLQFIDHGNEKGKFTKTVYNNEGEQMSHAFGVSQKRHFRLRYQHLLEELKPSTQDNALTPDDKKHPAYSESP